MRIISPFRDYYDVVASQGIDLTRIYERQYSEVCGHFPLLGWDEKVRWNSQVDANYPKAEHVIYVGRFIEQYRIGYIYILLAGKLYGGVAVKNIKNIHNSETTYFWNLGAWKEKEKELGLLEDEKYTTRSYHRKGWKTPKERFERVLSVKGEDTLMTWAIDTKIMIASSCEFFIKDRKEYYIINPCLKDYDFQKVLDPFTCYQELDMYIGGVLGNIEVIPELPDKYKVAAHGFGEWSFRKHKLDNK